MSRQPDNGVPSSDSARPSGLSNVLRGLTSSKSSRSPPHIASPAAAQPKTEFVNATPIHSRGLATNHMDALELLRSGIPAERISAADTLRYAISEYPLNPVLDIWYAAKDLIDENKPQAVRVAGWELLTECVKHTSSTDLERQEYFQTVTAPSHPDDFHLQLAALVDLTNGGRKLAGFDYETIPLLIEWLHQAYNAARLARKNAARGSKSSKRAAASGEDQNLAQLFSFIHDVMKFGYNTASEATVSKLIDMLLNICMSTSVEDDLKSCISILDVIVTFGSIPNDKLKECVQVLGSIFCLVPGLHKGSWHTLANLFKSHNGQATVRILLDILRNLSPDSPNDRDTSREIRGALAVLQKLLAKSTDKGYPSVPYALLVDGLATALKASNSMRVYGSIVQLLNTLFDDGTGQMHKLIIDEDWSIALRVCAECYKRVIAAVGDKTAKEESAEEFLVIELTTLIARLDLLMNQKTANYIPRQTIINFFTQAPELLSDATTITVLNYFREFRCCSPSDLDWEENISLVLDAFFLNRKRPSKTRLIALSTIMDAYDVVDLVGDGAEQNFIPRLTKRIIRDVAEETDIPVLSAIMVFIVSVAKSCDMELFGFIMDTFKGIVPNDRVTSPVIGCPPVISSFESDTEKRDLFSEESPSNTVTRAYVTMFLQLMNSHLEKSVSLFKVLVNIAKSGHCEVDARLSAMKLLFRLRADWAYRIYVTNYLDVDYLASSICRTEASLVKKKSEEAAETMRLSRNEHATQVRPSRGVSFSHSERGIPVRAASGTSIRPATKHRQLWQYPDPEALPCEAPSAISPILVSHVEQDDSTDSSCSDSSTPTAARALDISSWLDGILAILQGANWEIYSFVLVHLPLQLSNHAIFQSAVPQVQELRKVVCDHLRTNTLPDPPNIHGLRKADVAICLYQSLTMILSYHEYFQKSEEDEIVKTFAQGISGWERSAKACIHALSICCHELPLSMSKSLVQILTQMAQIITQPHVSVHILEFLSCLSRMHTVYVNFREEEFRTVFGICFRYLDYAREKRHSNRNSRASETSTPVTPQPSHPENNHTRPSDDLPQYVHAIAYHAIIFWFLALKLPDRANHVSWIIRKLFTDVDGPAQQIEEQAVTSVDFMQRVTYADADESAKDPYFTEDRFGQIGKKRWLIGNSIVTVKQGTLTGWAHVVKRQPSGTSAYTIREAYRPPPLHQIENHLDIAREGQSTSHAILPNHILVQLLSPIPQGFDGARPIALPDDDAVDRAIRVFDRSSSLDGHKVGVVYIGEGQTDEAEILANVSGSSDYIEFLNNLGTLTRLKGATFNTQGLDREYDSDGEYTFCWRDRVTEIVFHVTTQMPTNLERDPSCTMKKRHIGNDFVNIIFNDSGNPFKFDTFPSQFNFVNIVITPASRASFIVRREIKPESDLSQPFYMVKVMSKPGFPPISPASETKMVSLRALPGFIRLLSLNATMFAMVWHSQEGGEHISSWTSRLREIKRLRERYGAKNTAVSSSPPGTSLSGGLASGPGDSLRPASSVRDSLNSLRRTSVATFFTSASEQTSHRSSVLSTSTTTNDTEVGLLANPACSVVDSVDFTKWAS
ncbi:GTPase activating protein [Cordyceps javanica]|uniref:GTPase activating protein n=1 Tax=Cordyceps javanica TaxID=43265 RepID=A0A545WAM7_9HYPO|nr:GTPase activating protein [Cordyceps javanica]TQW11040.1 GTPase activating protein [Cordyceps javanica]